MYEQPWIFSAKSETVEWGNFLKLSRLAWNDPTATCYPALEYWLSIYTYSDMLSPFGSVLLVPVSLSNKTMTQSKPPSIPYLERKQSAEVSITPWRAKSHVLNLWWVARAGTRLWVSWELRKRQLKIFYLVCNNQTEKVGNSLLTQSFVSNKVHTQTII